MVLLGRMSWSSSLQAMSEQRVRPRTTSAVSLRRAASASPLHSASVHFTDLSCLANPAPLDRKNDNTSEMFGEDYLSPTRLRQLSGKRDLRQVSYLQISVNTQTSSLGNFGSSVPGLEELRCVESVVPCLRDLGTGLGRLKILWLPRCALRDLDGLPSLSCLQELYISHNEVRDVSVAAMLPELRVLDVDSNQLGEEDQLGYLGLCTQLSSLTLAGNPLSLLLFSQQGGEVGYRSAVVKAVPQLKLLDDVPVDAVTPPRHLSSQSLWRSEQLLSGIQDSKSVAGRPRTAISPAGELDRVSPDDSSDLTHGMEEVMCGNPVKALKARRRRGLSSQSSVASLSQSWSFSPSNTLGPLAEDVSATLATSLADLSQQTEHLTLTASPPLPSPPPSLPTSSRPHTAGADLRHRRYRHPSPIHNKSGQKSLEMIAPPPHSLSPSPSHSSSSHTPHSLFTHNE